MPYDFTLSELENSEEFLQSPPETQRAISREYIAQNGPDEVLNQYKSAVTDPEYQQLKPEERDLFRKSYSEFYGIDVPLEDVSFGTDVKDVALSGLAGTSAIPKAAATVAGWFGAEDSKETLLDIAKTTEEFYRSGISKQGREVEQQPFLSEQDGKWFGNNAIKKVFMVSAESLPLMVATAPIGGGASAAISKAKFLPEFIRAVEGGSKAGQWSHNLITFGASEAGTSALVSAADAGEKVAKMPDSVIAKSPVYQELIKQGLDPVSARAELRGIVEEETLKTQFAATLAGSSVAPGGGMAKLFQKGPRAGVVRETAEGVVTEGLQEGGQSGLEQFGENLTTQRNLDPTQSLSAGTAESVALGIASGGLMGGGMSGGSKLLSLKDAQQVAQDVPLGADPEQVAAQIETATAPTPPPNITIGDLTQDEIEGIAAVQNKLSIADAAEIDRIRNHVLPLLREKNPLVAPHIERIVNERSKMLFDQMVPGTGVDMQQISTDDLMDDWAETETDVQAQADARGRSVRFEQLRQGVPAAEVPTPAVTDNTEVPTDETQDPQLQAPQTIETGIDTPVLGQPVDEATVEAGGGVVPVQVEGPVELVEATATTEPLPQITTDQPVPTEPASADSVKRRESYIERIKQAENLEQVLVINNESQEDNGITGEDAALVDDVALKYEQSFKEKPSVKDGVDGQKEPQVTTETPVQVEVPVEPLPQEKPNDTIQTIGNQDTPTQTTTIDDTGDTGTAPEGMREVAQEPGGESVAATPTTEPEGESVGPTDSSMASGETGNPSTKGDDFATPEFPTSRVRDAYSHTSNSPGTAASLEKGWYEESAKELRDVLAQEVPPDKQGLIDGVIADFQNAYLEKRGRVWSARSGTVSSHIAGGSKFNSKQAARRGNALDRAQENFTQWENSEKQRIFSEMGVAKAREEKRQKQAEAKQRAKETIKERERKQKAANRKLPIINSKDNGAVGMTSEEWAKTSQDYKLIQVSDDGTYRFRSAMATGYSGLSRVYLTDKPITQPPSKPQPTETPDEAKTQALLKGKDGADETSTTDRHKIFIKDLSSGTATVEGYREAFDNTIRDKDIIVAELQKLTKNQLFDFGGARVAYRYKNEKKDAVVRAIYFGMLDDFNLTDSLQFSVGGGNYEQNMIEAIRQKVNEVTAQSLKEHADAIKAGQEESMKRKAQAAEGMKDPKTLDDLIAVMRSRMNEGKTFPEARMSLTPEQREAYDTLSGEKSRGERKGRADQQIRTAAVSTEGEIIETKHTKTGEPLFVVKSAERVDREIYNQWNSTAKRLGGYYSSYRGGGAVPGFQFKTVENAEAFLAYIGGNADQATAVSQERRNAFADNREQSAVERLREMANALTERADESLNRDRLANTSRRARMAASAEQQAESEKALAKTMNNIADAIASGDVKFLDRVRQKVQIEMLRRDVNTAKYAEKREKYKTYAEEQKHEGEPPTKETADYADFPRYTAYRSDLAKLGRQLSEKTGTKKLGGSILKVADDVTAAYTKFAKENLLKVSGFVTKDGILPTFKTKKEAELSIDKSGYRGKATVLTVKNGEHRIIFSPSEAKERGLWQGDDDKRITISDEFGEEVFTKATRKNVDIPWYFTTVRERKARLKSMGIETPQEYRAALREFITLQQQPAKPNKIKELERSMVGRANDGLDFFPTPATIAQTMVETADIKEGMSVLEPSAGMGHIAENIRETGVSPDVVEVSSSRRELLELKGFNVVGQDFMDVTEQYDRIIMNPPFSDRRDIQHVRHAYDLLKPGGRLVAIMGEGSFFGSAKKATAFREWLEELNGTSEKLEEGTFLDKSLPVNTGVAARMVVIDKPGVFVPSGPRDGVKEEAKLSTNPLPISQQSTLSELSTDQRQVIDTLVAAGKLNMVSADEARDLLESVSGGKFSFNKLRSWIPKSRGGLTKEKIRKYIKAGLTGGRSGKIAHRVVAEFSSPEELSDHIFYHGTGGYVGGGLRPSIVRSGREAESMGGGGYGQRYWAISVSKSKEQASNFTGRSRYGTVYPVILKKGANVVSMPELQDASDIEDIIEKLWEDGVDAVKIGDWKSDSSEQELAIINPKAIYKYDKSESFPVYNKKRFTELTTEEVEKIYSEAIDAVKKLDESKGLSKDERNAVVDNLPVLKFSEDGRVIQGFALPDGTSYMIPENIEKSKLWPVALHEIGVHVGHLAQSEPAFERLLNALDARKDEQSATGRAIRAAMARVPKSTKPENYREEVMAYLIEHAPEVGIARRFIAIIKRMLVELGVSPKIFTAADFTAMAEAAIRREARGVVKDSFTTGKGAKPSFGGPTAKSADNTALDQAKQMQESGSPRREIWQKTGWWQIVPGQWSFEIDDSLSDIRTGKDGLLSEVLKHPALFKDYPQIEKIRVRFADLGDTKRGGYDTDKRILTINQNFPTATQRSTIQHEVQHIIQGEEGFAGGGNFATQGADKYWRQTGEIEARLVQARLDMPPARRKIVPPWVTLINMLRKEGLLKDGQTVDDVLIDNGLYSRELNDTLLSDPLDTIASIKSRWKDKVDTMLVSERSNGDIHVASIIVNKANRNAGAGSGFMNDLTEYADRNNRRIVLSPGLRDDGHGTTSRGRLVRFYKRFGFIENKGRNKDYQISEGMYRDPQEPGSVLANEITRREFIIQGGALVAWAAAGGDVVSATPRSFREILADKNQTVHGALRHIAANSSSPRFRTMAEDLLTLLPEDGKIRLVVDQEPRPDAAGIAKIDRTNKRVTVTLYGQGLNESTLLHESWHAAVLARYDILNYYLANPGKLGNHHAAAALEQYRKVWMEFRDEVNRYAGDRKLPHWLRVPMENPDEFLTYALTNQETIKWMSEREYRGKTLRERFIQAIKGFFNRVFRRAPTWLDAVNLTASDLVEAMKKDAPNFEAATKVLELFNKSTSAPLKASTELYAQAPPPATSTRPDRIDRLNLSDQWERFIYGVIDNNDPRRRVLARADVVSLSENLSENTDILTIERLRGKKTAEEALRFWEDKAVPLLRDLARAKLATADLDEYAHAMHTPERNKRMQQVNAKGFIDRVVEHLNSAEAARVNDEIIDIRSDVLMTGGTRADRQDRYLQVLDDLLTGIAAQRADVDAQQTALNNRTFTTAEIAKGTPANLQARIDARSKHLDSIEAIRDRWELESPRFAGITDTEAADIVKRWKADPRFQALTTAHATLLEFGQLKLDILRESGQLSDVEYQSLVDGYDYYVPLHRDVEDDSRPVTGRVTGPTGSPIKVAKGSMLEVVHILAHSIQNVQTAINRKHKADAGRVLHNFAVANPDAGITVGKQKKEPRHDSEGNVVMYTAPREADNELYVRIDGERYTLTFDTKNATTKRFLESIKEADANLSGPMQALGKMVRILAMVNTTLSPEFIISNFSRDIQTAGIHMEDTEAKGLQARVLKNVFPAIRGILGAEYGKAGTHWGKIYRDFAANGGKIGWMQSYDGIKDLASQIESTSDLYRDGHVVKKSLRTVGDLIMKTNTAIENGVRLAFYDQMIKTGATPSRAALAASNLTVDFTRRGAYSPAINALYMFFNAGVQGNVRMIKAIGRSSKVKMLVGGIVATGFALQFLAYATGGDDETGQPYIDGIEPYIKERNMIFMKPGTKGEHFKIPMPYGYNGFYNIGAEIARAIHDNMSGRKYKVGQGAMRIVDTLLGTFNPLQSTTITQALAPTVIDPFVMVAENKTWAGSDLMPKESPFGPNKADAYRTWKSTPPIIKSVAQGLHKLTGGKGEYDNTAMVDISPETIEMMYETITGSAGRFVKDMVATPIRALTTDEPIESSKIPFKRRVYGEWSNRSISNRYYEQTEQVERFRKDYLAADADERKKLATDPRYKMVNYTRDADNMLDKLREARNKAEAAGRPTKVIKERILKLQTEYLKRGTL